jgi:hypothetical protein
MQQWEPLIKSAALVLVPMIPAMAIFKMFGNAQAEGGGPLAGLQWKFGGAFAGYVCVALLMFTAFKMMPEPAEAQVWTIRGGVVAEGQSITPNLLKIRTQPQDLDVAPDGTFELKLVGQRRGSDVHFPKLVFDLSVVCFGARTISLNGEVDTFSIGPAKGGLDIRKKAQDQLIEIRTPIKLQRNEQLAECQKTL